MVKKVYSIHGFDCANCAAKVERHLASQEELTNVTLDFAGDKLYLTYKDSPWSIEKLKKVIKEVETDELVIKEGKIKKENKIFTSYLWILIARIVVAIVVIVLSFTALKDDKYYWWNFGLYLTSMILISYDIYYKVINNIIHKQNPIDEYLLITLSGVGAFILASIQHMSDCFMDSTMVVTLFQIGRVIEGIAVNKSKEAINNAIDLRSEVAHLIKGEVVEDVDPSSLQIGDVILVNVNELIPIDGEIIDGSALIDTSSLTGEFVPVNKIKGESVFSGCLIKEGNIKLKVNKEYNDSTVAKLIDLISHSGEHKSKADKFVTKFARFYTPLVFGVSILVAVIGGAISSEWFRFTMLGLKMLVISCPCAIVISVPLAYFSAIGLASKNGIVVKGSNYLDELNRLKKIFTDKTGTLTKGTFSLKEIHSINKDEELMNALYICESLSHHPIATAIVSNEHKVKETLISNFEELPGLGVKCNYQNDAYAAGNSKLMNSLNINVDEVSSSGIIIYVSKNNDYLGYVIVDDEIKPESKEMISSFNKRNIESILLSGDKENNVKHIANELGISRFFFSLTPIDKSELLNKEKNKKYAVAFIGDGVNDAACIKEADIGFAMGGIGSDIAVENADIVIMNDNPNKVFDSFNIAKIARRTSIFNLVVALFIKFSIEFVTIISSSLGYPEVIPMWAAVLADTGLTVLLIINSLLLLYRKVNKRGIK